MERSWWWKALLYGGLVVLACLYLVPTVVPEQKQPDFIKRHFQKRIQLGLDLQGGLHLVYEVHVDKAVSDKVDRIASEIEDRLLKNKKVQGEALTISREGRDDIVAMFKNPTDQAKLDEEVLREFRSSSTWSAATPPPARSACGWTRIRLKRSGIRRCVRASRPSGDVSTSLAWPSPPSSGRAPTSSSSCPV